MAHLMNPVRLDGILEVVIAYFLYNVVVVGFCYNGSSVVNK